MKPVQILYVEVLQLLAFADRRHVLQQLRALRAELADHLQPALVGHRAHRRRCRPAPRSRPARRRCPAAAARCPCTARASSLMPVDLLHVLEDQVVERADAHAAVAQRLVGRTCGPARSARRRCSPAGPCASTNTITASATGCTRRKSSAFSLHRGVGQRRQDHLVGRALEDVVAVGRRRQHLLRGERAADAAQVLDQRPAGPAPCPAAW